MKLNRLKLIEAYIRHACNGDIKDNYYKSMFTLEELEQAFYLAYREAINA